MRRLAILVVVLALGLLDASPASAADGDHDGIGNARDRCPTVAAGQSDGCPLGRWRLGVSNHNQSDWEFARFASLAGQAVVGDWNGDGIDQIGTYDGTAGRWHLAPSRNFGDTPGLNGSDMVSIVGDWNGDGKDTVGLYDPSTGTFFLRNSNSAGPADLQFSFGQGQPRGLARPVAGDWDGDGDDTVGIFRRDSNRWRLRNDNSAGPAAYDFVYGRSGDTELPIAGDVDGDGDDSVGVTVRSGSNQRYQALPDLDASGDVVSWSLGASNPTVLGALGFLGDWDGDGTDTGGVRS